MHTPAQRLVYADSLRGGASLMVAVFSHYHHFSGAFQPGGVAGTDGPFWGNILFRNLHYNAYLAVDFFFILSGLIFTRIYATSIRDRSVSAWSFFVRRASRLYPIHLLTLCLTAVLVYAFHARMGRFPVYEKNGVWDFVANLLFLQDGVVSMGYSFNGPSWSLSVEVMLYVWFFFMARRGLLSPWAYASLLIGVALYLSGPIPGWRAIFPTVEVARGLIGFGLGILIQRHGRSPAPYVAMAALLGVALLPWVRTLIPIQVALAWCVFGLLLLALPNWHSLRRLLEIRPLVWLGDISLSVYLIHFPLQVAMMLVLDAFGMPIPYASPWFMLSYAMLILLLSGPLHFWFERPAQSFLRRRLEAPPPLRQRPIPADAR